MAAAGRGVTEPRTIRIKRRFGTGAPDELAPGELAASIHTMITLYIGDKDGTVRRWSRYRAAARTATYGERRRGRAALAAAAVNRVAALLCLA